MSVARDEGIDESNIEKETASAVSIEEAAKINVSRRPRRERPGQVELAEDNELDVPISPDVSSTPEILHERAMKASHASAARPPEARKESSRKAAAHRGSSKLEDSDVVPIVSDKAPLE
mmetsp:Transcript_12532/g.21666  ORF Transcript_12532/g.21666 Transcript_12532/m.21666 type:complete len:119 (-) Transcript_12532:195-551(-)|eukprot:CAMPEP_0196666042 /NCGR_PEP_ID=MMETSP1086-20130531/63634_1 /TAXON_ID=77921 /ORGANISM="Cyanoptyche  gloeocystis , Strain SAG4.97" /LENGTH=118 /DNA_ID=CAMNT_0042003089 /DNA_START=164 /DNA_END=520 /DNA_ORIENTATION=+